MGVFDTLRCEYELPDKEVQGEVFQTKSIRRLMDTYTITREGKLLLHRAWGDGDAPLTDLEIPYHGEIRFYTVLKHGDEYKTYEYRARFTRGRLESLSRSAKNVND
jgi:hypothetical protein